MLNRLHVQGYKALRDVSTDFERLTVFVGRNGVGKSSLLESIGILAGMATAIRRADVYQPVLSALDRLLSPGADYIDVSALCEVHEFHVTFERGGVHCTLDGSDAMKGRDGPASLLRVAELRHEVQELRAPSPVGTSVPRLAPDGAGLATVINYVAGQRDASIERIEQGLRRIVPSARRVRTQPIGLSGLADSGAGTPGTALEVEFDGVGWVPASEVSEGTLLALGLLTVIHGPIPSTLLLIDDLERGLHPAAQQRLVDLIRSLLEAEPELQVIATTHSPDLLDACRPEEVRVLGGPDGNAHIEPLKHHEKSELLQVLRTGEFWSSVGEDWVRG